MNVKKDDAGKHDDSDYVKDETKQSRGADVKQDGRVECFITCSFSSVTTHRAICSVTF